MQNNDADVRWVIGGAVAILIAGMVIVTFVATFAPGDNAATIASIGTMVTMGVAGVFGMREAQKRVEGKIDQNTAITAVAATEARDAALVAADSAVEIKHQLNGGLDQRMKACAEQAIIDAMPMIRQTMVEVLDTYTRPR